MSGFGLGGFGSGFLQGFQAMGQNFAQRGILQAERQNQARADRKMALEEELDRLREERAARESESVIKQRDVETRGLEAKYPYIAPASAAAVQGQELENQMTTAKLPYVGQAAEASVEGQRLQNTGQDLSNQASSAKLPYVAPAAAATVQGQQLQNTGQDLANKTTSEKLPYVKPAAAAAVKGQELQNEGQGLENQAASAKLPYVGPSAAETLKGQQLSNQDKGLDVSDKQRQENSRVKVSEALTRIKDGTYTPEDLDAIPRLSPIINIAKNPTLRQDTAAVIGAVQQAAARKGDVEVFNQPEVMGALNRTFGEQVNVTRGMPLTEDGRYVAKQSELVKMIRHPTENLIGFEVRVQPEPSPQRKAEIAEALKTASPQQAKALQAELNPAPYQTALTDQRTPVAQGGKMRWFTPQEVQKAVIGIQGIGQLQANQPDLINELIDLQGRNDRGELNRPADGKELDRQIQIADHNLKVIDTELKVKQDKRADQKEPRTVSDDAYKEAAILIDKEYGSVDSLGGISFEGGAGRQASAEKIMVRKVLKEHPELTGAEAVEEARARMPKQSMAAPLAQSGVKSTGTGQKSYRSLFLSK